jgi:hypothetical protein
LHTELANVGLPVVGAEAKGTPQFGSETVDRVRAFQKLHDLPVTGAVDPTTGGIMTLSAMVLTESDRDKLQNSLREAEGKVPNSPQYNLMLARSAILAGDYDLAVKVQPAREVGPSARSILDITKASSEKPQVPFPENFYSYRYDLVLQDDIGKLQKKAPAQSTPRLTGQPDLAGTGGEPSLVEKRKSIVALRPKQDPGTDDPPGVPEVDLPPTPPDNTPQALADSAQAWMDAVEAWQLGNAEFAKQRYASAVANYNDCQKATLAYFAIFPDYQDQLSLTAPTLGGRMDDLVVGLASDISFWSDVWTHINFRRQRLTLEELGQIDWASNTRLSDIFLLLEGNLAGKRDPLDPANKLPPNFRKTFMDARLVVIAAVLVPLARAEANRLRRQYAAALDDLNRFQHRELTIPNSDPPRRVPAVLACEFIEYPFARLLAAETLLDQAEAQYKARLTIDDEPDAAKKAAALARLKSLADDFTSRKLPRGDSSVSQPFENLLAALTYSSALESHQSDGKYVPRTKQAVDSLYDAVTSAVDKGDVTSMAFQSLGQAMTVKTIFPIRSPLPGLTNGTHPHEPFVRFTKPASQQAMREMNPRVYAVLLAAHARLLQIWSGFNYLGYRDDYLPPWRFQYLLDRSRYFAEHAKNAQRDYLNFLSNAENEELKELSAAQNVELEKANIQIETARVDQAGKEVAAAKQSKELASLEARDAQKKVEDYKEFEAESSFLDVVSTFASIGSGIASAVVTGGATAVQATEQIASGIGAAFHGLGALSEASKATGQRDLEIKNLERAAAEAIQANRVADAKLDAAKAAHVVAGLQRQTALLRHEFALQSLQFMRNRVLNTEQWYRLAGAIRSVSDTYLRYAIETSFLAQQTYNFEGDRRLNVIRFDYDQSDLGGILGADFLLRDLDTLEQDLIVTQKTRLQHVRYVLSLAREFPDLLSTLGETGVGTFSMRLEQLERHFPGLFNLRIDSVEVQPIALMDTTRTSIELTHLGAGMVRLKAQPGASPLNTTDLDPDVDWLRNAGADWPVKVHVSGPDSSFFSGISRQEAASLNAITANERGAFEGLPAASSWRIDMSLSENQVVTGTFADLIITFNVSGYDDPELRAAVKDAIPQAITLTSLLSAQNVFPDAFYDFSRTGRMVWNVPREMLTLNGDVGRLRNIGFSLRPGATDANFSRLMTRLRVNFRINDTTGTSGAITLFTAIPDIAVTQTAPMTVAVRAAMNGATELAWDFGDDTPILRTVSSGTTPVAPAEGTHTYAKPGRYVITLRCVQNNSLSEFRVSISVSRSLKLGDPLIVTPSRFTFDPATKTITIGTGGAVQQAGRMLWRVGDITAEGNSATFKLKPGNYILEFAAVRKLNFRAYGDQRFVNGSAPLPLRGFSATTNRTFDLNGAETNGTGTPALPARNELAKRLFDKGAISPEDDWTFELIPEEVLGLPAGTANGAEELDLADIQDAVLSMEYEITTAVR